MAIIGASNSLGGLAGSNAVARLLVVISGTSAPLEAALAKAQSSTLSFSEKTSAIGGTLTKSLTLPLLAVGAAAVKMASDYNQSLAKIQGLTPIVGQVSGGLAEVDARLKAIAADPQVSATLNDLAQSLYFAGSAGLTASEAFDVVKLSAQGMTVGMGDAADVSKVLIFAMNNYRTSGLTAADAMDALTAAIKEGTAEPNELAIALGRLLPVANQAGVEFKEVVASIAALTNLGVPTRVATTYLRALFGQLLAPTKQATDLLNDLGITASQLRYKLQQGPIEALQFLMDVTKGNADTTRGLISQIRGLSAYYGLTGDKLVRYKAILDAVNNSQGAFQTALDALTATPAFKFQKALQELNTAAIDLGNELLPVFTAISRALANMAKSFQNLPGPVKTFVAALMSMAIVAGPLLKITGILTAQREAALQAGAAGKTLVPTTKALAASFITAGLAAATAVAGFQSMSRGSTDVFTVLSTGIGTILAVNIALKGLQTAANAGVFGVNGLSTAFASIGAGPLGLIAAGIGAIALSIGFMAARSAKARQQIVAMGDAFQSALGSGQSFKDFLDGLDGSAQELATAWATAAGVLNTSVGEGATNFLQEANSETADLLDQIAGINDIPVGASLGMLQSDMQKYAAAAADAVRNGQDWGDAIRALGGDADQFAQTLNNVADQQLSGSDAANQAAGTLVDRALPALNEFNDALDKYNTAQQASIGFTSANEQAIADYAQAHGVSIDFVKKGLDEYGIAMAGASDQTISDWEQAYFGVDKNGQLISGSAAETAQAVETAVSDMSSAMEDAFNVFEKLPKDTSKSFSVYLDRLNKVNDAHIKLLDNVATLQRRGLGTDLIQSILENAGPGAIAKFANATDKELAKYVRAFQVNMALGDAEVLKEGAHLQKKAKWNIEGFAQETLNNKHLVAGAAQQVVASLTDAFVAGNLKPAALDLFQDFLAGVDATRGVSKQHASAIAVAMGQELLDGHNWTNDGRLILNRVAQGIAERTGVPVGEIKAVLNAMYQAANNKADILYPVGVKLAQGAAQGVKNKANEMKQIGILFGDQFAQGLDISSFGVKRAAANLANEAKQAFHENLKNSPKYGSYYMGIDFADQFGQGMKKRGLNLGKTSVKLKNNTQGKDSQLLNTLSSIDSALREGQSVSVTIDGHEVGRAMRREGVRHYG